MDIEERAEKYVNSLDPISIGGISIDAKKNKGIWKAIRDAYLAGAGQAQRDYVKHYERDAKPQ